MSEAVTSVDGIQAGVKRRSPLTDFFIRLVKEQPLGTLGGIIVLIMLLTGILADLIAPFGYNEFVLSDRMTGSRTG
jgi:peptide/nickel transport system permease protein